MNWIDIEQQQPEPGSICLVWYTPAGGDLWHYGILEWDDVRRAFADPNGGGIKVSHWAPLPGPP